MKRLAALAILALAAACTPQVHNGPDGSYAIGRRPFPCGYAISVVSELPAHLDADLDAVLSDLRGFGYQIGRGTRADITIRVGPVTPGIAAETWLDTRTIVVSDVQPTEPGWAPRNGATRLIAHEMGHALGLDHVNDTNELMHGGLWVPYWGPGTGAGLRNLACV